MRFRYCNATAIGLASAALAAPASAPAATGDVHEALATAQRHAQAKLGVDVKPSQTYAFRSERDADWVLVDGYGARTWAVFLERGDGGWVVRDGSTPAGVGPAGVPCDIRVPFSESAC
jgi:hypothetical protein